MQTFFPTREDIEGDDAIDYVILGESFYAYAYGSTSSDINSLIN